MFNFNNNLTTNPMDINYMQYVQGLLHQQNTPDRPSGITPLKGTKCANGVRLMGKLIPVPVKTEKFEEESGHYFKGVNYQGYQPATTETLNRMQGGDVPNIKKEPVEQVVRPETFNQQNVPDRPALITPIKGTKCANGVRLLGKLLPVPVKTERIEEETGRFFKGVDYEGQQPATIETLIRVRGDIPNIKREAEQAVLQEQPPLLRDEVPVTVPNLAPPQRELKIQIPQFPEFPSPRSSVDAESNASPIQTPVPTPIARKVRRSIFEEPEDDNEDDDIIFLEEIRRDRPRKIQKQFLSIKQEVQTDREQEQLDVTPAPVNPYETPDSSEEPTFGTDENIDAQIQPEQVSPIIDKVIREEPRQRVAQVEVVRSVPAETAVKLPAKKNKSPGRKVVINEQGNEIRLFGKDSIIIAKSDKAPFSIFHKNSEVSKKRPLPPPGTEKKKKIRAAEKIAPKNVVPAPAKVVPPVEVPKQKQANAARSVQKAVVQSNTDLLGSIMDNMDQPINVEAPGSTRGGRDLEGQKRLDRFAKQRNLQRTSQASHAIKKRGRPPKVDQPRRMDQVAALAQTPVQIMRENGGGGLYKKTNYDTWRSPKSPTTSPKSPNNYWR